MTSPTLATLCATLLYLLTAPTSALAQKTPPPGKPANLPVHLRIANAAGARAWPKVKRVSFTWNHTPRKLRRAYVWDVPQQKVQVTMSDASGKRLTTTIALNNPAHHKTPAYRAFINDSYWVFFTLHLAWDRDVTIEELPVAGQLLPGGTRHVRVIYGSVGVTPRDTYMLHINDAYRDVGWIYRRASSARPTLIATREGHVTRKGITVPTLFKDAKGNTLIQITGLKIE